MIDQIQQDLEYIFQKTESLIKHLDGKTIFITGATGFIGKWILEYFLWLYNNKSFKFQVLILSRNPESFLADFPKFNLYPFKFYKGDVTRFDYSLLPKSDLIVHAATDADAKLNNEEPLKMIDTILEGTRKVLDYSVNTKAEKLLFLSSGAVYGVQPSELAGFSEVYNGAPEVLSPNSAYGESKRMAELYCACYLKHFQIKISIARCFAFVGPYLPLNKHFAIGNFIENGLKGENIVIRGNGSPLRSYMYSADLIIWLLYILILGKNGDAYNVGSDLAISIKNMAMEVASFFPDVKIKILSQINPTDRNQDYVPSINKIKRELSVPDILPLRDSIYRTINYHSGNE